MSVEILGGTGSVDGARCNRPHAVVAVGSLPTIETFVRSPERIREM